MCKLLKLLSPNRTAIRLCALSLAGIALLLIAVAIGWPGTWEIGPAKLSLHTTRNLVLLAEFALLAWLSTYKRVPKLIAAHRKTFSWPRQLVALLLSANVAVAVAALIVYPQNLLDSFRAARDDQIQPIRFKYGENFVPLENFAARCRENLPADARVLYHGLQEGWVFAYEVYPRRVFMLPSDWRHLAASCHLKPWFQYLPKDPLETYWKLEAPPEPDERENFISAHGITHEVFFDAKNPTACRWEVVR
jgi:hypothetical protein